MSKTATRYVRVGHASDVPPGRAEVFDVEDRKIAVYRLEDGFYAIDDICTHDGGPLAEGEIEDHEVICPRHGARFDIKTGQFEPWRQPFAERPKSETHSAYGVYTDSRNNAYLADFPSQYIWKIDAKTGATTSYKTPSDYSRPRRGRMDSQDRLWFAEWRADKIGMFDTKSGEFMEWAIPGPFSAPYDAQIDKNGWVWTDNMMDDRVSRLDPKTGQVIQYLMPIETNSRRVAVDNSGPRPAIWLGNNHQGQVMKVEPLE